MADIIEVNDGNFAEKVEQAGKPVLVDLWAPWCGPCRSMGEVLKDVAAATDSVTIAKLNVDENEETAARLHVSSIPLLVLFKDGQAVAKSVGLIPKDNVLKFIKDNL
jgi:thioredoxin 1